MIRRVIAVVLSLAFFLTTGGSVNASSPPTYVQNCAYAPAGTSTGGTITCSTQAPSSGDMFVAAVELYTGTAQTITTPSGTWNLIDQCVGQSKNLAIYSHTITSSDASNNSFAWSWGSAFYSHINMVELSAANTSSIVDGHGCAAISGGSSPQTITSASVNPQSNDLPLFFSATSNVVTVPAAGSASGGSSGGCTMNVNGNSGGVYLSVESCPATISTSATTVTETYSTAQSGGYETDLIMVAPVPAPPLTNSLASAGAGGPHQSVVQNENVSVVPMTPIYTMAQSSTSCGGNYEGFDATAAQDVFWGFFMCHNDTKQSTFLGYCTIGSNCRVTLYVSPSTTDCSGGATEYNYFYNNPGFSDAAFVHTASPHSSSNRLFATTGGSCDTSGGATGTDQVFFAEDYSGIASWEITNWITPSGWLNGSTWNGLFHDNQSMAYPSQVYGSTPNEYPTVAAWRKAIATHVNNLAPYVEVLNSEGPGQSSFPHNNGTGTGAGIVNWAIDDTDICDNLTTSAQSSVLGFEFEKALGNPATEGGVSSDYIFPSNVKTYINTASEHWNDQNCAQINLTLSGMTGENGTTSWVQRAFGVVIRGLMTRSGFDGQRTTANVVMGQRYPKDIQNSTGLNEQAAFPEDELAMTQPYVALTKWCWGGGSCTGNGQSNSDTFGGGCYGSNGDTGGVNAEAQLCGSVGTGPDGGTAPVYVREFAACYKLGKPIGPCAVIANMSTSTNVTLSSLTLNNSYTFKLTPTGGSLYDDPVTPGHPLCAGTSGQYCDGAWAETSITMSSSVPHCTVGGAGSNNAYIDAMNSGNDCYWILLSQ